MTPCHLCVVARTRQAGAGVVGQVGSGGDDLDPVTVEGQPAARHEDQRGDVDEQETAADSEAGRSGKSSPKVRIQSMSDEMSCKHTCRPSVHTSIAFAIVLYLFSPGFCSHLGATDDLRTPCRPVHLLSRSQSYSFMYRWHSCFHLVFCCLSVIFLSFWKPVPFSISFGSRDVFVANLIVACHSAHPPQHRHLFHLKPYFVLVDISDRHLYLISIVFLRA